MHDHAQALKRGEGESRIRVNHNTALTSQPPHIHIPPQQPAYDHHASNASDSIIDHPSSTIQDRQVAPPVPVLLHTYVFERRPPQRRLSHVHTYIYQSSHQPGQCRRGLGPPSARPRCSYLGFVTHRHQICVLGTGECESWGKVRKCGVDVGG